MSIILSLLLVSGSTWHAPHDSTHSLAATSLPGGGEMLMVVGLAQKALVSLDGGLTWEVAHGDDLQLESSFVVDFHPEIPASGSGMFLVGTRSGVWGYDPITRQGIRLQNGLPSGPLWFVDLDCPASGMGPAIGITDQGDVFLLDIVAKQWTLTLSVGDLYGNRGAVAIAPEFDGASTAAGDRDLLVGGNGQMWRSQDAGASWVLSNTFNTPAGQPTDWVISQIELSPSYRQDHLLVVARGAAAPIGAPTEDVGEIWRSQDFGSNFQRTHQLDTSVASLEAAPPGPSGQAIWYAAGRQYPGAEGYFGTGILRSLDGGLSWDTAQNFQDFLLEDSPGHATGALDLFYEQDLHILPDYAQTGRIWYVRQEGMFTSEDEGLHWRQLDAVAPIRLRDLESTFDARGEKLVFAAGYGSGALVLNGSKKRLQSFPERTPMSFNKRIAVSPQFAHDGQLALAGNILLWNWQATEVPPANVDDANGWHFPPMADPVSGRNMSGYPRGVRYSPRFDSTGNTPGADRTLFWFTAEGEVRRSEDNLATAIALPDDQLGMPTEIIHTMAIAPTYEAGGSRTDAFAGTLTGILYRLDNEKWTKLADFGTDLRKIEVSPTWDRPNNPELFLILKKAPFVMRIDDQPGNFLTESLRYDLPRVEPTGIALHPDFANQRVLFLSTYSSGVYRIDLNAAVPGWTPVGSGLPAYECNDVALSADFVNDSLLYVATAQGLWECEDTPGAVWTDLTTSWMIDNTVEGVATYSPNGAMNPNPGHSFPWQHLRDYQLPAGLELLGDDLLVAHINGDHADVLVDGIHSADLLSFRGNGFGSWTFEAIEDSSGTVLASTTASLQGSGVSAANIHLDFPQAIGLVRLRIIANLQPGEMLAFDGFQVSR